MEIDLDSPTTSPETLAYATKLWHSIKVIADGKQRYDVKNKYLRIVNVKGACIHQQQNFQVTFLELQDGTGMLTAISAAILTDLKKTKCDECYIKAYTNYAEMHGFEPFLVGTIEQIRYANKIRCKAHMKHEDLVIRAITLITEPTWWLDNSNRTYHAKIWREVNALTDEEVQVLNNEARARREKQEEQRLNRVLRQDKLKKA